MSGDGTARVEPVLGRPGLTFVKVISEESTLRLVGITIWMIELMFASARDHEVR
jgi:hypothetical protein